MKKVEIFVTNDIVKHSEYKGKLSASHIQYKEKVVDSTNPNVSIFTMLFSSSRRARGSLGQKQKYEKTYYLYVDEKDEEQARYVISH